MNRPYVSSLIPGFRLLLCSGASLCGGAVSFLCRLITQFFYVVALGFGVSVHYAAMLAFATLSFWTVRTQGITYGYYSLISLARYPDSMFKGFANFVFSWLIPVISTG